MSLESSVLLDTVEQVLREALELKDASLVIYRPGVLVEFKTELLRPALASTLEGPYRGWQIGAFEGHHCHLDLASISRVWFDAEPVSCQGGRLNYTVWFFTTRDCGNPHRRDGLFSVTLNAPYERDGTARVEVIEAVYSLWDRHRDRHGVSMSEPFAAARAELER